MVNLAAFAEHAHPFRCMVVGDPGSGKTGAMACFANAGFKLRVIDFDGNPEPLVRWVKPECLKNIDMAFVEDPLRYGMRFVETHGLPEAFQSGWKLLDRWKYTDPYTGEEVDLGQSKDWGPDTIVVLDGTTVMSKAAKRRVMARNNRTPDNFRDSDYGSAMDELEGLFEKLSSLNNRFHAIVLAHLKLVGPADLRKGDDELTKELKEKAAEITPTKLFPAVLGKQLPRSVAGHFPCVVLAEQKFGAGGKFLGRRLSTISKPDLDLKVPAPDLPAELPIEDGMLTIFEAVVGPVSRCLEQPTTHEEKNG